MDFNPCIVIPVYNHKDAILATMAKLKQYHLPVFIVDDGSDADTQKQLQQLAKTLTLVRLFRLEHNQGKGAAVIKGLREACAAGFSHALQIDADGQHDTQDVSKFLTAAKAQPKAFIMGQPIYNDSIPKARLYGRYINNFWVCIETLSWQIKDSMCGFRMYPLNETVALLNSVPFAQRMAFDVEIMVRLNRAGVSIQTIPTKVLYPENGISHFKLFKDNYLLIKTHTRLCMNMLYHLPYLIKNKQRHKTKHWSFIRERGTYSGISLMLKVYQLSGQRVFNFLLYPVIAYFYLTGTSARQASEDYLEKVHHVSPNHPIFTRKKYLSYHHFIEFARSVLDKMLAWSGHINRSDIDFPEQHKFINLLKNRQGAVFIGSHLGNLELIRAIADTEYQGRITAIVFTEHAENFNRLLKKLNPNITLNLVQITQIQPDAAVTLRKKVEQGEFIVIVGDRTSQSNPERVCYANFFGKPAPFPQGPFILASLMRCPVYLLFCIKEEGQYKVYLELFSPQLDLPCKNRQKILQEYIARYAERLEYYCLKSPLQWFNFYDFWGDSFSKKKI
ncbi:MAG TPA: glycosyltransferase [Thermodesulfovibrionia bacterium]|nr:glycosyltransferase [Thermodesulfovibrionia bacterium]